MGNDVMQWRAAIGIFYIVSRSSNGKQFLFWCPHLSLSYFMFHLLYSCLLICNTRNLWLTSNTNYIMIILLLLVICGDIEKNPGPNESEANATPHISIAHLNIRSLRNKVDFVENTFSDFHVICLSETHLSNDFESSNIEIEHLTLYRKDFSNYSGGLVTYVSKECYSNRRADLEILNIQTLWSDSILWNWTNLSV